MSAARLPPWVLIFVALLGWAVAAGAQPPAHRVDLSTEKIALTGAAGILIDPSGAMGVADVAAADARGEMRAISVPNLTDFGTKTQRTIWL